MATKAYASHEMVAVESRKQLRLRETVSYFLLAILGMSFWFFVAVPFASHRETYWWLAMVRTEPLSKSLDVISVTYRPVAQAVTWLAFRVLDPDIFPTSGARQLLLQLCVYSGFAFGWWILFKAAPHRRLFAWIACFVTGVFFPGYVHLFHVYGLMYVPVMLMVGALVFYYASGEFRYREGLFAAVAMLLVLWHPFAPALFAGFYFGFLIETARQRTRQEQIRGVLLLGLCLATAVGMGVFFARPDARMSLHVRLLGFATSYLTTEVNRIASVFALVLALLTIASMNIRAKTKLVGAVVVAIVGLLLLIKAVPLVLLWLCVVLIKLVHSKRWSLFFLTAAAAMLPFGAGIGAPVFALFAVTLGVYVTSLDWSGAEARLATVPGGVVDISLVLATASIIVLRTGVGIPVLNKAAQPLLAERERSYQLEQMIYWLHNSQYCSAQIGFAEDAGSPIDSGNYGLVRNSRPPSSIEDVRLFWNRVLRCPGSGGKESIAMITFGGTTTRDSQTVFVVPGRYAGTGTVAVKSTGAPESERQSDVKEDVRATVARASK